MTRHKRAFKQHKQAKPGEQATSAPLAFLLRDPNSPEELRRTIDAWSRFIERHLHDDYAEVRSFAHMSIVRRAAAYAILGEYAAALSDVSLAQAEASADPYIQCKALEIKAIVQADQEDHTGSLTTFAELWPLLPAADLPAAEQGELWLARGKCYGRLKRYEDAIRDFTEAMTLDDRCGEAWCWRGLAHSFLDHPDDALADMTQAVVVQPDNATCYRIRGVLLRQANRFAESLEDLVQAETLAPNDPWASRNKQETLLKWLLCRPADALDEIEAALAQPVTRHTTSPSPAPQPARQAPEAAKKAPKKASQKAPAAPRPLPEQRLFF